MKEQDLTDELASIRSLMEKSSRFISLSGLSGVLAGVYALAGAVTAFFLIYYGPHAYTFGYRERVIPLTDYNIDLVIELAVIAFVVLAGSLITGIILARKKAKQKNQPIWGSASKQLLFNMAVPLITGGLLAIIMLLKGHIGFTASTMLIFYGIALVSASNFTYHVVRYLGLLEILLGLAAACLPGYGLYFWAMGFGVLHIIYGSVVHYRYDR